MFSITNRIWWALWLRWCKIIIINSLKLFWNFKYGKCFKMNLIISSELSLTLKVLGLKSEVWGFADVFIIAFDNCYGSFSDSFLYLLYKLGRILFVKMLGNLLSLACHSRYSKVNILSDLVMLPFYMIANQFKSLLFLYSFEKKIKIPR
jgi:hypothetical protein